MDEQRNIRDNEYTKIQAIFLFVFISLNALAWIGYGVHLTYNWFVPNQGNFSLDQEKSELLSEQPSPGHVLISSLALPGLPSLIPFNETWAFTV